MKKSLMAMAVALCTVSLAHAGNTGFYLGGQLGRGLLVLDSKSAKHGDFQGRVDTKSNALAGSVNLGYNFKPQFDVPIRTELSFTARGNAKYSAKVSAMYYDLTLSLKHKVRTLMLNNYYDIYTGGNFTPYVSLGIGYAFINSSTKILDDEGGMSKSTYSDKSFAYSFGLGTSYKITDNWSVNTMVRATYDGTFKSTIPSNISVKSTTYDLMFGVLYNF